MGFSRSHSEPIFRTSRVGCVLRPSPAFYCQWGMLSRLATVLQHLLPIVSAFSR